MKVAAVSFLIACFLAGCTGGTAPMGAGGSPFETAARGGESPVDVVAEEPLPQSGGVIAMPVETEDEKKTVAEGTVEPVCEDGDETSYRVSGRTFRVHRRDGVEKSRTEMCYQGGITLLFSDGDSCRTWDVPAKDCRMDGELHAKALNDVRFYSEIHIENAGSGLSPGDVHALHPSDPASTSPKTSLADLRDVIERNSKAMKPSSEALSRISLSSQAETAPCDSEGVVLWVENQMVMATPDNIPECGGRRATEIMGKGL